ncbi:MAG: rhodanese-like domain-containing protein [Nevskiaceae bacterium]|nr:MAG: rhodanese-like domain-containing protein [Nevskiaceae bacterium]TBR71795.1 MAG: rhodanese-like domain-containing protein [Nevskiaceae bacterium]
MALKKGIKQLVAEAMSKITTLSLAEARAKLGQPGVQFVDIRDVRELQHDGTIPGAVHAPRGMLEFWVDPDSPYFKPVFGGDKQFILFCKSGWRSALATAQLVEMGVPHVAHIEGGYTAWQEAGGPTQAHPRKPG